MIKFDINVENLFQKLARKMRLKNICDGQINTSGLHLKLLTRDGSRDNLMQRAEFISELVITSNTDVNSVVQQSNETVNYSKINVDVTEAWN